jgi:nitrate reductase beta subunit
MLTAGDEEPVIHALKRMFAMRIFKRKQTVDGVIDTAVLEQVGLSRDQVEAMYKTLAIANYEDRFVVPTNQRELSSDDPWGDRSGCGFSFGDGCNTTGVSGANLFGSKSPRKRKYSGPAHDEAARRLQEDG